VPVDPVPGQESALDLDVVVPADVYARYTGPATITPSEPTAREATRRLGVVTWEYDNDRGVFTEASPNIEQLTGYPRERFYTEGELWPSLVHPDDAEWTTAFIEHARASRQDHEFEYRIVRPDGQVRWLREVDTILLDPDGAITCVRGVLTDITERKELEVQTRQAATEFETVFGLLRGLYFRLGRDCTIARSSASMPGLLADAVLQIEGSPIEAVLPTVLAEAVRRGAAAIATGERSWVEEVLDGEGEERRLLEVSVFPLGESELAAVVRDMAERLSARDAETRHRQQLQALATEIERTAERERRRLAEEIHDRVSQTLAIARMRLVAAEGERCDTPEIHEVRTLLEQAAAEARTLTSELAPVGLYELGISSAIRTLAEELEAQYGLRTTVDATMPFQADVDDDTRAFVFRAVRELLMNVIKHARTNEATVSIVREGQTLRAAVSDRGAGGTPDPSAWRPGDTGGFGLFSLRERAHALHGTMGVTSTPGEGTTVVVSVPVRQSERP